VYEKMLSSVCIRLTIVYPIKLNNSNLFSFS